MKKYFNNFLREIKIPSGSFPMGKRRITGTLKSTCTKAILLLGLLTLAGWSCTNTARKTKSQLKVGAYYFDGWAGHYLDGFGGRHDKADDPTEPWAKNAPTHLTRRMVEEFPEREPAWGWRDDSQEIMERQIDLAADNGIEFFSFCWYWRDDKGPINPAAIENLELNTCMNLYMKAKNKDRIKFCLLVANSRGFEIRSPENWKEATEYWMQYFNDPQYVKVDGKPLVIIFNIGGIDNDDIARMQEVSKEQGLKGGLSIAGCGNTANKNFNYRTHYNMNPGYVAGAEEHKYSELVAAHEKNWKGTEEQPYIPEITVGWDKRPWEDKSGKGQGGAKQGWYFPDRTPEQFKNFLNDAIKWMDEHPTQTTKERMLLIYAWNEFGEGGYLVPTKGDPNASYLKVIKSIVTGK
jgi:hypothetical protein